MNILVVDTEEMGLDFCVRCAEHGHDVRWYRYSTKPIRHGEGFKGFTIVPDWRQHMEWARSGLIITTGNWRFLYEMDRYRDYGYKIFAPTVSSAQLEINRGAGMDVMKAAGIDLLPFHEFASFEEAERFARKSSETFVFKPLGDETDKSMTYVAKDPADLVGWLRRQMKSGKQLKDRCILQQKIERSFEIGVNGWLGPDGFLSDKLQISFEHKPLMPGDIGPNTGEMISVSQYVEDDLLASELLIPLEPILMALGHRGDFCVGAIVDKSGKAWPLEVTSRLGWPAFFSQLSAHRGDPAKWMRDLLDGKDTLRVSYDVAIAAVCGHPRFPYQNSPPELVEGNQISGIDEHFEQVHCVNVMRGRGVALKGGVTADEEVYMTSGEYVMVVTALGKTIERARKKLYSTIDGIHFPNMIYRNDAGVKVEDALPAMHQWGYAQDLN